MDFEHQLRQLDEVDAIKNDKLQLEEELGKEERLFV